MANSRAYDLQKKIFSSLADLVGVRIWSDKDGDLDARGIEVSELLDSAVVEDVSPKDYVALTPAGLKATTASFSRSGIVELSTTPEIQDKTGIGVLKSSNQYTMQEQWLKDWCLDPVQPVIIHRGGNAISWMFNRSVIPMGQYQYISLSPTITGDTGGTKFAFAGVTYCLSGPSGNIVGVVTIPYSTTAETTVTIIPGNFVLFIPADRSFIGLKAMSSQLGVSISVTINAVKF